MLEIIYFIFTQKMCGSTSNIEALNWIIDSYLDILCQWVISDLEWSLQFSGISSTRTIKQNVQYNSA